MTETERRKGADRRLNVENSTQAAVRLADEIHAQGLRERLRNAALFGLLAVVGALVIVAIWLVADLFGFVKDSAKARNHQLITITQIARDVQQANDRIIEATDPNGCQAKRAALVTAALITALENDNRAIHHQPLLPVPAVNTDPCPGEPGGPPLTPPTTSPKQAKKHTATTVATALAPTGSGSGT